MPSQKPFLVIHGLQGILVISPGGPYRQRIMDFFPEGHLGEGFIARSRIRKRIGPPLRATRRNIIHNWSLHGSAGGKNDYRKKGS